MRSSSYRDDWIELLADPVQAGLYLADCFNESDKAFLLGLRDVVAACGGVTKLATATGLSFAPAQP